MNYGFVKVAAAVPSVKVGDVEYNTRQISKMIAQADDAGVSLLVFPELSVTGYTCQDLFRQQLLVENAETALMLLLQEVRKLDVVSVIGVPVSVVGVLVNCAAVVQKGRILALVPKTYLPNYGEFYEKRWFASAADITTSTLRYAGHKVTVSPEPQLFTLSDGTVFGVELCEDVWSPAPPSTSLSLLGADIIVNLSATDELIGKHNYLCSLLSQQSARTLSAYVYASSGYGESSQDAVYSGNAMVYENGTCLAKGKRFQLTPQLVTAQVDVDRLRQERRNNTTFATAARALHEVMRAQNISVLRYDCQPADSEHTFVLERTVSRHPFIPSSGDMQAACDEILSIQVMGLARRVDHTHSRHLVIGISGGLDSTLALLVAVKAFDALSLQRSGVIGVTMPGFGTTSRTYNNAIGLMKALGVTIKEISIADAVKQHFSDIGHNPEIKDVTYENSQARERTQILMDLANEVGGLVVGTGDLSELALGWATYNGDHMSMYGVNSGVPKTLIQFLVRHVAEQLGGEGGRILQDIISTPISPELIPADENGNIKQKTEDLVGPYELHDFFLYYFLRFGFSPSKIFALAKKAFLDNGEQADTADDGAADNQKRTVKGAELGGTYDEATIKKWLKVFVRRFFAQQFKRSCLPDGPKVGSVSLSPRADWRMPSDAEAHIWLMEADAL